MPSIHHRPTVLGHDVPVICLHGHEREVAKGGARGVEGLEGVRGGRGEEGGGVGGLNTGDGRVGLVRCPSHAGEGAGHGVVRGQYNHSDSGVHDATGTHCCSQEQSEWRGSQTHQGACCNKVPPC